MRIIKLKLKTKCSKKSRRSKRDWTSNLVMWWFVPVNIGLIVLMCLLPGSEYWIAPLMGIVAVAGLLSVLMM